MTDNNTRTVANVKSTLSKNGGEMLTKGSLDFMFERKAVFEFDLKEGMNLEEIELELIDAGLEEIEEDEGVVIVTADYTSFGAINSALEAMGVEIKKANLERMSTTPVTLTAEQQQDIDKVLDRLEDDEDVQKVFTNIA
jgi:transcriptional/translational regulatory protein YebC/TACO1